MGRDGRGRLFDRRVMVGGQEQAWIDVYGIECEREGRWVGRVDMACGLCLIDCLLLVLAIAAAFSL